MKKSKESNASDLLSVSFVPYILRKQFAENPLRDFGMPATENYATLLWIDICDFSSLCNKLMKDQLHGVEIITDILQNHYSSLLKIITEFGGQPLFFAGDGLMSAWLGDKATTEKFVAVAAACAQEILNKKSTRNDRNELLSLHAIISAGYWQMTELEGVDGNWLFNFSGQVFDDLTLSSHNKAPDEILISEKALACLDNDLRTVPLEHNTYILKEIPRHFSIPQVKELQLTTDAVNKLKAFVPKTLTFPITRDRLKWIAEIRPVTIVFVKLPNKSMHSSENRSKLLTTVGMVTNLVREYDALLNQVWMDEKESNMLICFGPPPSAHNDNPERGINLSLQISQLFLREGIENNIGVSTGMAYCGIIGNDLLRQYTVIGDVVNLSERIAEKAKNKILCDKLTYSSTNKSINFKSPVLFSLKGHREEIALYEPDSNVKGSSNNNNYISVGRSKELEELSDAFKNALNGSSCNTLIVEGDSGMGKSKLLEDFKTKMQSPDINIFSGAANFLSRNTPYGAFGEIFFKILALHSRENAATDLIKKYGYRACLLNAILPLNIPDSVEVQVMTGGQRVLATHNFLLELLNERSKEHPLIIIIDDAQWLEENSWQLIESIHNYLSRCFVILAFQKTAGIIQTQLLKSKGCKTIVLKALSEEEEKKLICERLGVATISEEVFNSVHAIAKGNPFFCIELADSLRAQELVTIENNNCSINKNVTAQKISLPETVRGALRRKIDRLNLGSQLAMKAGSVAGFRFSEKIINNIYPIASEKKFVPSFLNEVMESGFTHKEVVDNLDGYSFNSAVTAEVAYEMTLSEQRRHLHRKCAEWYEKNFSTNLNLFYVQVAHHWMNADENEKAAIYLEKEAIRLFRLGFVKQALDIGLEGVSLLGQEIERDKDAIVQKTGRQLNVISALMTNRKIEDLTNLRKLRNTRIETIIRMLLELAPFAHQCQQPELFALISVTCLLLTLENGNGDAAAEVYSMYAIIHKVITGDTQTAFAWSNLAIAVDKKSGFALQARVIFIHCWFIALWMQPLKELIPQSQQGSEAGFASGDITYACFNLSLTVVLKSTAGVALDEVIKTAVDNAGKNNQMVVNAAFHLKHEEQVAKAFKGLTGSLTSLTDEKHHEEKDIASICETDLFNQVAYYYISKLKLNVHAGNWEEAMEWGNKALPLLPAFFSQPGYMELEQYYAIAALYLAIDNKGDAATMIDIADKSIEKFNAWAQHCPGNFLHKSLLLQAIKAAADSKFNVAEKLFTEAAANAEKAGFIQDSALAWEHLMRMQQKHNLDYKKSLQRALKAYENWGADAKVKYLQQEFAV